MQRYLLAISFSLLFFVQPRHVLAGGLEYAGGGTTALGRGGATAARADTPMVLVNNPAGLAELRGHQLMVSADFAFLNACVTPIGYYGWNTVGTGGKLRLEDPTTGNTELIDLTSNEAGQAYFTDPYDQVCLDQSKAPIPQFAFSLRLTERLGFGAGATFPAILPQGTWGSATGIIEGKNGLRPAATRYMGVDSNNLGLFPSAGIGYRLTDWLRVGATFEWGMIAVSKTTMTALDPGSSPNQDFISHITAEDFFVPAANFSLHLVPMDALDVVFGARIQDSVDAEGRVNVKSGEFNQNATPTVSSGLKVTRVQQAFPWKLWAGVRFADRIRPRPTGTGLNEGEFGPASEPVHDPLTDERWDIEVDAVYELNSMIDSQDAEFKRDQAISNVSVDGMESIVNFPQRSTPPVVIPKGLQNQLSLRVGSTINVLPGMLGVSLGGHYENRGVTPNLMQLDTWGVQRFGLHAGLTLRVGPIDFKVAYARVFQETITVAAPAHDETGATPESGGPANGIDKRVGVLASRGATIPVLEEDPSLAANADGVAELKQIVTRGEKRANTVNAGIYESGIDLFSVGMQAHF